MKIYIRHVKVDGMTWFQIAGTTVMVDYPMLKRIQDSGHEIMDLDAIRTEMARNN